MKLLVCSLCSASLLLLCIPSLLVAAEPWLLINTKEKIIKIMQDNGVKVEIKNIALGRNGVADFRLEGDNNTPTGSFRISWINRKSGFRLFFGLNYPNKDHAEVALRKRLINVETYFKILKADYRQSIPPQHTVLGGQIGIHGLGDKTDANIHSLFNWTRGCIAVTNAQIAKLDQWIKIGTKVVIH